MKAPGCLRQTSSTLTALCYGSYLELGSIPSKLLDESMDFSTLTSLVLGKN